MSLLTDAFEEFVIMDKSTISDGYGGTKKTWTEGTVIDGAIVFNNSGAQKIAESMGATGAYYFIVKKNILLDYHDVVKRVRDGRIFRMVNDSDDLATPSSAALNMRQYSAEEWSLT